MATSENPEQFPNFTPASQARKRTRRWLRSMQWSALGLLVVLLLAGGLAFLWLRSATRAALPQLDGSIHVAGLTAPVTIRRDAHGVPHIQAASQQDLFFAQGYVTAQDRLWQMDSYRRNANGELAEVMGSRLLRHDIAQRVLQYRNTAQRIYANLPADERARLDAYAQGVNAFIQTHQDSLPPEFRLLHYRPSPWSGTDSLSIGMMMVETLDSHWDVKMAREQIAAKLHNPRLEADLYPVGSWRDHPPTGEILDLSLPQPPQPPSSNDDEDDDRTQTRLSLPQNIHRVRPAPAFGTAGDSSEDITALRSTLGLPTCSGCIPGSNNWVIGGKHTASGKPLLSNDMHLSLTVPNIWYMADLSAPGYHAAGVTLTGFPFVIAGHNEHVAWGFTALYADVQDLYVEKLDGKGNFQAADGSWKPLAVDHEVIHVRGGKDVPIDVHLTAHGPLLNPMFTREQRPIALKWSLYDTSFNTIPVYKMNVASNWADFSAALTTWCWPTQNLVYSDDQGHIAYHAVGKVPLRPAGLAGVPIQDSAHEWNGYIPFDDLPNSVDPPSGFLATANSRVTTEKNPYPLTLEWADPYRTERIYKSLQGRDGLKPADMLAMQTDIYSEVDQEMAHRFAYAIDHADGADARLRAAADLMRSWDGKLAIDSAAASLVTRTHGEIGLMILKARLGDDWRLYEWSESNFAEEEIIMHNKPEWLPPGYKDWDAFIADAVRRAMQENHAPSDVGRWNYGSWHIVDIEHPLSGLIPFIGNIAGTGAQPLSGDGVTVKQVGRAFGPSQRFTMDWSNIDGSTENIVLGESGNPFSPYFRDQWNAYYNGATFALPFTPAAIAAQTSHTLQLEP